MLIYGIDSDDGLMEHIRREISSCKYFHVISNENGIYSLGTDRSRCRPGEGESLVCKFENGNLTWDPNYSVEYHGNIIDD
jgi:hypothetical protein